MSLSEKLKKMQVKAADVKMARALSEKIAKQGPCHLTMILID